MRIAPLASVLVLIASAHAQEKPAVQTLKGPADSGRFLMFQNEERIGINEFKWNADGSYSGSDHLALAGQELTVTTRVEVDADGVLTRATIEAPTGKVVLENTGAVIRRTIHQGEKEMKLDLELKPGTVIFENHSVALWGHAIRHYDHDAGGRQEFPLLLIPQGVMEGWLERLDDATRTVAGRDISFRRYTYGLPGLDIELWCDGDRLVLADVPAQAASIVREGYEALRSKPDDDPLLSQPTHEVVIETNTMVPMRDGVKLATDIYRPDAPGQHPVILLRTPYQKDMAELEGRYYARRGYVAAIQDCRGRFGSEGTWEPFVHEARDGHDAIEWLAGQPWSSGKVGMIGASYGGWVQWWAASEHPPHLVTIIPNVSPPDPFHNIPYEYGSFFLLGSIWWAEVVESEATADLSGTAMQKIGDRRYHDLLKHLPVIDLDEKIFGRRNPYWRRWIEHNTADDYWAPTMFAGRLERARLPVFHQSGWFDGDGIGSKLNYAAMRQHGHPHQKLVLGPWGHTDTATRMIGERDFGNEAQVDLQRAYLRWFDRWLKGVENGIDSEPLVSLFVMGANTWLHGDAYPLPQTRFEKWYFASDGNANTSRGDGRLLRETTGGKADRSTYTYDPGDPTPAPDFAAATAEQDAEEEDAEVLTEEARKARIKARRHTITDGRHDMLVFTTEPLGEPLTICGPVSARLYASTSARDTDWYVRLLELDEDGEVFPLVEGRLRARFRESVANPSLLEPGRVYAYDLDMWQTGIEIPAGRRLRVEIASATFPVFSRNLNTGGHNEMETDFVPAEQVIYHGGDHRSHVLLPVIPAE